MSNEVMGLRSLDDDQAVALQSVQAHGKLQGLMLRMKLRQVYRNTTDENLECVYTFPLAWGSVLLGMAVELNGKRMVGSVAEKKEAETRYEKAIQSSHRRQCGQSAHLGRLRALHAPSWSWWACWFFGALTWRI